MNENELINKMEILAGLKTAYAESKKEWEAQTAEAKEMIDDLEAEITEAVLAKGETVKSDHITAVWNKGKTTWDGKLLEGYALAHPDIIAAKRTFSPTVSFRLVK